MKKIFYIALAFASFASTPVLAAPVVAAPKGAAVKQVVKPKAPPPYKPVTPEGYAPITWAKAPGVASFFRAPEGSGSLDFLTRIYLPQNQIQFITAKTAPLDVGPANPNFMPPAPVLEGQPAIESEANPVTPAPLEYRNMSFERIGVEPAKQIDPEAKFIWDAPFFNSLGSPVSDLSMALKYTNDGVTTITSGSRSVPDMALPRRMLIVNNQTGTAGISDFDAATFVDVKAGDQAIEGFHPSVVKTESTSGVAARLFLGVSDDGKELMVYCSRQATVDEASMALTSAGAAVDHQVEVDGGGSASCGYNLPGQFFVEPSRSVPLLMGAVTVVARGAVTGPFLNVRKGPGAKYATVDKLSQGAVIRAYEEKNGWLRIGENRWISKSLVKSQSIK